MSKNINTSNELKITLDAELDTRKKELLALLIRQHLNQPECKKLKRGESYNILKDGIAYRIILSHSIIKRRSKKSISDTDHPNTHRYQILERGILGAGNYGKVKESKKVIKIDDHSIEINNHHTRVCKTQRRKS